MVNTLRSFIQEFVKAFASGKSWRDFVGKVGLMFVLFLLVPYSLLKEELSWHIMPLDVRGSISILKLGGILLVVFWVMPCIGFALARMKTIRLVALHVDLHNFALRVNVGAKGQGAVKPRVRCLKITDVNGNLICPVTTVQLELAWTGFINGERPELREGRTPESVTVIWYQDQRTLLYGVNHKQPLEQYLTNETTYRITLEFDAGENYSPIVKGFSFCIDHRYDMTCLPYPIPEGTPQTTIEPPMMIQRERHYLEHPPHGWPLHPEE